MKSASKPPGPVAQHDQDFSDFDIGPAKSGRPRIQNRRGRLFPSRSLAAMIVLAVVWAGVLLDPEVGSFMLMLAGAFATGLVIMGLAMGLGFLGLGFASAGGWIAGRIRRATQWPDE
ncbi:MAG: hypothetical protein ACLQIB_43515 [Isosphaeraceae bacterium]